MIKLEVSSDSLAKVSHTLRNASDAVRGRVLKVGAAVVKSRSELAFHQADMRPSAWPPLAESTIKRKAKKNLSPNPLMATGNMKRSLAIKNPTPDSIEIGSYTDYASYQQFGTNHIPARPFMPEEGGTLTPAAEREVSAAMQSAATAILSKL